MMSRNRKISKNSRNKKHKSYLSWSSKLKRLLPSLNMLRFSKINRKRKEPPKNRPRS